MVIKLTPMTQEAYIIKVHITFSSLSLLSSSSSSEGISSKEAKQVTYFVKVAQCMMCPWAVRTYRSIAVALARLRCFHNVNLTLAALCLYLWGSLYTATSRSMVMMVRSWRAQLIDPKLHIYPGLVILKSKLAESHKSTTQLCHWPV